MGATDCATANRNGPTPGNIRIRDEWIDDQRPETAVPLPPETTMRGDGQGRFGEGLAGTRESAREESGRLSDEVGLMYDDDELSGRRC